VTDGSDHSSGPVSVPANEQNAEQMYDSLLIVGDTVQNLSGEAAVRLSQLANDLQTEGDLLKGLIVQHANWCGDVLRATESLREVMERKRAEEKRGR
jgi:hypothetical protein